MLLFSGEKRGQKKENGDRKWGHATFSPPCEPNSGERHFRPPDPSAVHSAFCTLHSALYSPILLFPLPATA